MLGLIIACLQTLMAESTDRHFLRPSEVLSADRIDAWDAINLVIYAKLPLLTVLKGRDLIAGYLRRNEMHVIQQLKSFPGDMDLLEKYNSYFERLTFPVSPSRYEPLLDQMSRANEYALPYFFHEHHLMVDRRRRAALFATQYKALQGDVMNGDVILQLTEAERAPMLLAGSWMTNNSLKHLLQKRGVLPWWENEKNLSTHALLERVVAHRVGQEIKGVRAQVVLWQGPDPYLALVGLPRAPVCLVHAGGRGAQHRYAASQVVDPAAQACVGRIDIIGCRLVLRFVIKVEDADPAAVPLGCGKRKIEENAAVLAAREGNNDVVEVLEHPVKACIGCLKD